MQKQSFHGRFVKFAEGHHFVTLIINNRKRIFGDETLATLAQNTLTFYHKRGDYDLLGYVIMPDHIHFVCNTSKSISELVRDIKKYIARKMVEYLSRNNPMLLDTFGLPSPLKRKHTYQVWQQDFYDFNILSEDKLFEKLVYIYENPVRKGLCKEILEYKFSDAHRYFGSGDPNLPKKLRDPKLELDPLGSGRSLDLPK